MSLCKNLKFCYSAVGSEDQKIEAVNENDQSQTDSVSFNFIIFFIYCDSNNTVN